MAAIDCTSSAVLGNGELFARIATSGTQQSRLITIDKGSRDGIQARYGGDHP